MELNYAVHFLIRKGLGPAFVLRTVFVHLDDVPDDLSDWEIKDLVRGDAEEQLCRTADYPVYGKNWRYADMERC